MMDYKIGDRVRAKLAIYEPADEDAPGGYLCSMGARLIVRSIWPGSARPLSVSHDHITDNSFRVALDEIERDV